MQAVRLNEFPCSVIPLLFIPFRDEKACARVRAIRRVGPHEAHQQEVPHRGDRRQDLVLQPLRARHRDAHPEVGAGGEDLRPILPVGPVPQYRIAAEMINRRGISCRHLITFNMDEYANEKGETAPADWEGSFATSMRQSFFEKIDPELRPLDKNIHFPTHRNIKDYWKLIEDAGGADCCYGGIGWCGHIAFWESHWAWSTATTWRRTNRLTDGSSSSTR